MAKIPPVLRKTADQRTALKLLAGPASHVLLYGGSRSGKTFILLYALLVRALRAPGSRHIILRYRCNSVRQSIWCDTLPKVARLAFGRENLWHENRSDGCLTLTNGAEIWPGGLDREERSDRILGREFATIYFNECSELSYDSVLTALTRLAQKTELANKAFYDCNPPGKTHWTYELFQRHLNPTDHRTLAAPENYVSMIMNPAGNRANLPEGYVERTLASLPERQRMRFLEGRFLDSVEGALWTAELLDRCRVNVLPTFRRVVIGVDPAVTSADGSDETGIVCAASGDDGHYYVLEDASMKGTPLQWAGKVCSLYHRLRADRVCAEVNNGGDLIESVLRNVDPELSFRSVRAARGKIARAEPVAALYEQGKVHHAGIFRELEDQMCSYQPLHSAGSPDRMDALVWALTELSCRGSADRLILA